jgi:spore coat protein H
LDRNLDWIEIWNEGPEAVDLAGFSLTDGDDNVGDLAGVLEPDARLVLYADDSDLGADHLPFALGRTAERLTLRDDDRRVVQAIDFGVLLADHSFAWTPDGWGIDATPTPGAPADLVAEGGDAVRPVVTKTSACVPSLVVAPEQPLEGETVALAVQCSEGSIAGHGATIFGGPLAAPAGESTTWTPGLADAGTTPFLAATWTPDPEVLPSTVEAAVDVADAWREKKNVLVEPLLYQEEWGLPVLHLDPEENLDESYGAARTVFLGHEYTMEAKYRGASSLSYPQKSFTLKFDDKDKIDLGDFGMGHRDHLVLVTTFDDNSYVRQKMVYDLWAALADDALLEGIGTNQRLVPRSFFVVLYLDGIYAGLYMAIDHIDDEFVRDMGFVGDGNLYKSVDHDANFARTDSGGRDKNTLHDGYEKKEGEPPNDFSDLDALVAFSADSDEDTFRAEAPQWMEVDEFVDWFFLVMFTDAADSAGKNAYLYDEDPADIDFHYAPWDMNHSLGQDWRTLRSSPNGAGMSYWTGVNGIFDHFFDQDESEAEVGERAQHLLNEGPLEAGAVEERMDTLVAQLGRHRERAWDRWGDRYLHYAGWNWRNDFTTPDEELDYLRGWIEAHDASVRAIWEL